MKIIFLIILYLSIQFLLFSNSSNNDLTNDEYLWIKNDKIREQVIKIDESRSKNQSKAFFTGSVNIVFFYYFDVWQGIENDHLGDFGYSTRDFTDNKYHSKNSKGEKEENPWGNIETGFFGNFKISSKLFQTDLPMLSDNSISFEFNWEFNWMQAGSGIRFTFSPIPIYYSSIGFTIGTGWEWLWESDGSPILIGMGLSTKKGFVSMPLLGPVLKLDITNGLQMDFSNLPGQSKKTSRWTHVILTASVSIEYQGLLNIDQNQPYIYINRLDLDNLSGWYFSFTSEIGYMFPVIEDETDMKSFKKFANRNFTIFPLLQTTIGFNITHYNDSKMNEAGWGSDFISVSLNPVIIFSLPFNFNLMLCSNFINNKRYRLNTLGNNYYEEKVYEDWYFTFNSIGIIFGWDF